jgi:hypothetical protein
VKAILVLLLIVATAMVQVTVAPLFPISGAVPDFALVLLVTLAVFAGPRAAMLAIPFTAIFVGFATDRAPGLLIIAYLPLLPLALGLQEWRVPLNQYMRVLAAGGGTGLWIRVVLALAAIAQGADVAAGALVFQVLLPGLFLDLALLTIAYAPFRLIGWSGRGMNLQRGGF